MAITAAQALAASASDGGSTRLEISVAPRFAAGDRIRTRNINPRGHTRLPLYLRNCVGVVAADLGVFVFPDTHAHGGDQNPSTSTACTSARKTCGAVKAASATRWSSTCGTTTWIRPDERA